MKRILFFDIDATLTKTTYDKKYDPIVVALSEIYGKPISKDRSCENGLALAVFYWNFQSNSRLIFEKLFLAK